ncbi:Alpha/Beta hydrolase protein [Mycena metata]|uniref:Alpha/Beta hydrolase protein n=1 Tax=Mycena metata TaxID=1033252 RepID=A0AAD7NL20_9AGAR|nr:Alpha/Beta hydrolase protein [Mycena metata]
MWCPHLPLTHLQNALMSLQTLSVDVNGTAKLAFNDSGNPGNNNYITIFAVHGMGWNNRIFKRVQTLSAAKSIRIVAVNRRQYKGSTPYTESEAMIPITGSDEEKANFIKSRGVELANFIDTFIQNNQLPPISDDGKTGGVALLGWSAGNLITAAAIANLDALSDASKKRLKSHLRGHIMQEPPSIAFGLPLPAANWSPHMDTTIPADKQAAMFTTWITSYFDHGDLSTRDVNVLSYIVPSAFRPPTIYDMTPEEIAETADQGPVELPGMFMSMAQSNAVYRKACYSADIKSLVPSLKTTFITGDATCSYSLAALWSIQDDNKAEKGNIKFVVIPGANHFWHWDDAEEALKTYAESL